MPDEFDYESLLERAHETMPEDTESSDERWSLPEPDVMYEGRTTVWKNFQETVDAVRRDPEHLMWQCRFPGRKKGDLQIRCTGTEAQGQGQGVCQHLRHLQ